MLDQRSYQPIGIFDSGIGGLTVAHAVTELLPQENIVYFGDTAHLPYGDKSTAAIQAYAVKICDMLLQQHCKLILIACHSASAAAFELVKEYVGSKATVINVIDPVINWIREYHIGQNIGLIGTKQTVQSNIYKKKLDQLNQENILSALATPLLVPMIEEGFADQQIIDPILYNYLEAPELNNIDALVLGCTHYPLVKQRIVDYYQMQAKSIQVIDPSVITAQAVVAWLDYHHLHNKNESKSFRKFYISDYTESFAKTSKLFFTEAVYLEHYPLWE